MLWFAIMRKSHYIASPNLQSYFKTTVMKKNISVFFGMFLTFLFAAGFASALSKAENPLLGSWVFNVSQAPWEYSKGKLVFETNDENVMTGKILFDSGIEFRMAKITQTEENVTMEIVVQGYPVKTVVKLKDDNLSGHTVTPDGSIPFSAKRFVPEE